MSVRLYAPLHAMPARLRKHGGGQQAARRTSFSWAAMHRRWERPGATQQGNTGRSITGVHRSALFASAYTCPPKTLLLPSHSYRFNDRRWLETDNSHFPGIGRRERLERIAALGSISKAAQAMNMACKRAWDLVNSMNAQAATPLTSTAPKATDPQ